jgi:ParB family chromosome partitioning protein
MRDEKGTLGRNFEDLIKENAREVKENEVIVQLDLKKIKPNSDQPRTLFDKKAMNDLISSIKEHGILQPIIVKRIGSLYMLVAGERRLRAAKALNFSTIPGIVRDYNSIHLSELALIENLQREDLTPIEEAIAFQTTISRLSITHEELAKKIGKSRTYITNMLGLLHLPASVIESVNHGIITMGHARALSKIKDQTKILKLHERIIKEKLSVRDLESIIRNEKQKHTPISKKKIEELMKDLNKMLPDNIKFKLSNSQLSFKFDNEEELKDLINLLRGGNNNEYS